jgi:hypothetical protein
MEKTMMKSLLFLLVLGAGGALADDVPARVASLFDRIQGIESGDVCFSYAPRPGVYGNGRNICTDEMGPPSRFHGGWGGGMWESGPVRVLLEVEDRDVVSLDVWIGSSRPFPKGSEDLGVIPPEEAAAFLLMLAKNGRHGDAAAEAIFPATLADGVEPWPALFDLARDRERPDDVRRDAVFWLGQAAGHEITKKLGDMIDDPREDVELRKHAVFVLSQRSEDESVPRLIEIARTHVSAEVREAALFWLAQSDDPRVLDLLEEILLEG